MHSDLPLLIEPSELESKLNAEHLRIIELGSDAFFEQHHIPGANWLEFNKIIAKEPPVMGLLPEADRFAHTLGRLGITPKTHVVACDNEGNGRASRFLWTLLTFGHTKVSLLNGGSNEWVYGGHPTEAGFKPRQVVEDYPDLTLNTSLVADKQYILDNLDNPDIVVLDARSPAEYMGDDVRAEYGGHIPGAINFDWRLAMDVAHNKRIKPESELGSLLSPLGITPDKEIIVHCQTHHRSAHTFIVLKSLGFPKVKGYPGSWSDWGNDASTPKDKG